MKQKGNVFFPRLMLFSFFVFAILNILVSLNLSFAQVEDLRKREEERIKEWEKALKLYPVPTKAIKLDYKFSFPDNDLERGGVYLFGADHLCLIMMEIFISQIAAKIVSINLNPQGTFTKKIGRRGKGQGNSIMCFI